MDTRQITCRKCGEQHSLPQLHVGRYGHICEPCRSAHHCALQAKYRAQHPGKSSPYKNSPALVAYQRWLYANSESRREKSKIRAATRRAISAGRLTRQPCEVCGAPRVEAHHDDYSRPLEVRWLCPTHHREHHKAQRLALAAAH